MSRAAPVAKVGLSFSPCLTSVRACRAVLAAATLTALAGCGARALGSKTPAEARDRLAAAVSAKSTTLLWRALDLDTRWSWMSVQRAHREAYDITLSNLPEGQQRERMLRRFEPGATAQSAAELFSRSVHEELWSTLAAQLAASANRVPQVDASGINAEIMVPEGRLAFKKSSSEPRWGWGYSGLADEAEQLKRRAIADLEVLRNDAAEYERAAARGTR